MSDLAARRIDPELLLAQAGWLRGLALRLVRDDAGADDVVQETMVAALERPPEAGVPVRPWLARVARNFALRRLRGEGRRERREAAAHVQETPRSPAETVAQAECFREVVDAVLALDPPYRDVVLQRFFDGLETAEVARRLGIPEETARTRLKRALAMLRARLDAKYGGDRRAWAVLLVPAGAGDPGGPAPSAESGAGAAVAAAARVRLRTTLAAASVAVVALVAAILVLRGRDGDSTNGALAPDDGRGGAPVAALEDEGARDPAAAGDADPVGRTPRRDRAAAPSADTADAAGPAPAAPPAKPPAFVVRVVDEQDALVTTGEVRIAPDVFDDTPAEVKAALQALPAKLALSESNPWTSPALPVAAAGVSISFVAEPDGGPPTDTVGITLSAENVEEAKVVVRPPRTIRVTVVEKGTRRAIAGAWAYSRTEAGRRRVDSATVRFQDSAIGGLTDEGGVCVLENLGAGSHRIQVVAKTHVQSARVFSNDGDVTVEMTPGAPGTVRAHSFLLDGTPAAGSHVSIGEDGGVVAEDGSLVLHDIPPGEHELFLMEQMIGSPPLGGAPTERIGVWCGERPFKMEPGAAIDVGVGFVRGDGTVVAEVTDGAGLPLRGVRIALVEPGRRNADTSPDGVATFREVPDGKLRFSVKRAEDRPDWMWTERTPLAKGETRRLRIVLADAEVTGRIATDGTPFPDDVKVVLDGEGLYPERVTAPGGSFTFRDVPAGRWWIRAEGTGAMTRPVEVVEIGRAHV